MVIKSSLHLTYRIARRIVIFVIGVTVLLIGVMLVFLPGPAVVVIPAGLAILSLEFAWARHWLHKMKDKSKAAFDYWQNRRSPPG